MSVTTDVSESENESALKTERAKKLTPGKLTLLVVIGLLFGLTAGWTLIRVSQGLPIIGPRQFHGMLIESPPPLSDFTLASTTGEPMSLRDFRGKVVLLYFGYTFCPDVCPATMAELKRMMSELGRDAEDVQVIMISVDPQRDTLDKLGEYVTRFHPSFIGMTGDESELLGITTQLGIYYAKHEGTPTTGYLMDHTASVSVMDQDGRLRLVFPFGVTGEDMAADVRYLLH